MIRSGAWKSILIPLIFIALLLIGATRLFALEKKQDAAFTMLSVPDSEEEETETETTAPPETTAPVTETTTTTTTTVFILPDSVHLNVEPVLQLPELPTGCEITSLTALLRYCGFDVEKTELADKYLSMDDDGGCRFTEAFVGSPYLKTSFGCYAPVIVQSAEAYLMSHNAGDRYQVLDLTGTEFEDLYRYLAKGNPVIVWGTQYMAKTESVFYWYTDDEYAEPVYWMTNEHCMLLTGYDTGDSVVYVTDPLCGNVKYDLSVFRDRYDALGQQAIVILQEGED